jgi:hypothetical protein
MKKSLSFLFLIIIFASLFSQNINHNNNTLDGEISWYKYINGSGKRASYPVLTPEENIIWVKYTWAGLPTSTVFCYSPQGDTLWTKEFEERFEFAPTVIPETNSILIISTTNEYSIYCLNMDGSERWNSPLPYEATQSLAIDSMFNIYIAMDTKIISLDSSGVFRWEFSSPGGEIKTPLSTSRQGIIYFGVEQERIIALKSNGSLIFNQKLFGYVRGEPTIDLDGKIYMTSSDVDVNKSKIEVFNIDGSKDWEMTFNEPNPSSAIIGNNNFIYVRTLNFWGGGYGKLYKIDKEQQSLIWNYPYGPGASGTYNPTLAEDGTIFLSIGGLQGKYVAVEDNGSTSWELDPIAETGEIMHPISHMLIGNNGNIYTLLDSNYDTTYLMTINSSNAILANSAWPIHKHDQFNTSLANNEIFDQPDIHLNTELIDFEYVETSNTVTTQMFLYNKGNLPLDVEWLLESEVFNINLASIKANTSEILAAGDSLIFDISFSPTETIMYFDTINFFSNDPDQPNLKLFLRGRSSHESEIKWSLELTNSYLSAPSMDDFENIYIASFSYVWKVNKNGEIIWEYEYTGEQQRSDAINLSISDDNNNIFFTRGSSIICIDSSAVKKWEFKSPTSDRLYPPAISNSNQLLVSESNTHGGGNIYSLNFEGQINWKYPTEYNLTIPCMIDQEGNTYTSGYVGGNMSKIFSINAKGILNWQKSFTAYNQISAGNNRGYYFAGTWGSIGNHTPKVINYDNQGQLNWKYELSNSFLNIGSSVVTHPNNNLIFTANDNMNYFGNLFCLNQSGELLWEKTIEKRIYSTPSIANNGLFYFGCENEYFYSMYPNGDERWKIQIHDIPASSPLISDDGTIYFSTNKGKLFAVYGENGGLANSIWPTLNNNLKRNSSIDSTIVGISKPISFKNLSAKPNPFKTKSTIEWHQNNETVVEILIFDLLGNEILRKKHYSTIGNNQFIWDNIEIKNGIYLLQIKGEEENLILKLIKQ